MTTKERLSEQPTYNTVSRRGFLFALGGILNAIAALLLALPVVGYVFSSFRRGSSQSWISLGAVDKFPESQTRLATYHTPYRRPWDGTTTHLPCWVRRLAREQFQVFAVNCTHLGCPVRWFQESRLFMCPCHGGVYYEDGSRAAGPPPRRLFEYQYKVENGQLWVRGGQLPTLSTPV
ncbi:MAG: ubiquinol-cytochrome c reductase iron-sulfur subunit [Candidatus Binatia bacterium]